MLLTELPDRYTSLNFLFPDERKPQFGNDRVEVTRAAADKVAQAFNSLVNRGEERETSQRFILQCVTFEEPLPLDNLDENMRNCDALFEDWPPADCIIGNPPYQSKNKIQEEYGRAYLNKSHDRYPDVSGLADYCVYWFRRPSVPT